MIEDVLGWLGITKGAAIGGFAGSVISLKFIEGAWWQRIGTACAGWACAAFLAPLAIEVSKVTMSPRNELAVAFIIALFGMSVTAQILKAIPEWVTALKVKLLGGPK